MAIRLSDRGWSDMQELRYQPTPKRVRVRHGATTVADSPGPVLVWEPRRVVPSYAVPESDILVELTATEVAADGSAAAEIGDHGQHTVGGFDGSPPLLDPRVPFTVHSTPGERLTVRLPDGRALADAAFRPAEPDLAGLVLLDFAAFDWLEEDEALVSHPRDPFHRIDVRRSSREVRIEHEGVCLAESRRARFLFEGAFPFVRYYLPREDVTASLEPSALVTACAYKGFATYWSVSKSPSLASVAWSYEDPLDDATPVRGLVCFFNERVDIALDGVPQARPVTPWS